MATKPKPKPTSFGLATTVAQPASKLPGILQNLVPYLAAAGTVLVGADENNTGADDYAGHILAYAADVLTSVLTGGDIPPLPDELAAGVSGKITGTARIALLGASAGLAIAQMQLAFSHPKAGTAMRYINQVVMALLAGKSIPAAPASLLAQG